MRAEPRDFQSATPTGFAEQTAHSEAGVDQSQIHVFAGERIAAAHATSSGRNGRPALDFRHLRNLRRIVTRSIGRFGEIGRLGKIGRLGEIGRPGEIRRLGEILSKVRASITVRSSSIGAALVVAFGLGWACASIFDSTPNAIVIPRDQKVDLALGRQDSDKDVRRDPRIANAAIPPNPAPAVSNKPKLSASAASTRLIPSIPVQVHAEPQSMLSPSIQERTSPSRALSASSDSNSQLPLSPVPETKPTTIAGWTVREVYGEKAVLVGPDRVWTVKTGDTIPGVGRIDTIVRWGSRWIVATTAGLISTE
jgi:hypothetical protein